ncbi:hypothetical protein JL721_7066 [Aureococcus anophagefferens]|nr:hypothetical protein JL721_7066 [Aureococcus anophagefferens]
MRPTLVGLAFVAEVAGWGASGGRRAPGARAARLVVRRLALADAFDDELPLEPVKWEAAARYRCEELRRSIAAQRVELEGLERRLICCAPPEERSPVTARDVWGAFSGAFRDSFSVFRRRYDASPDPTAFVINETSASLRILGRGILLPPKERDARLASLVKYSPLLAAHAPGILSRLDRLENYVPGIMDAILDGDHLGEIEPHLDGILDRFDEIEPHVPWVLDNIDALAPHVGALMRHIDELLLYADEEKQWATRPAVPALLHLAVGRFGPHLPLLRPHLRKLQPHFATLVPAWTAASCGRRTGASANADVLLYYFGWALRIPLLARCPRPARAGRGSSPSPRGASRGGPWRYCSDVQCRLHEVGAYGRAWNSAGPASRANRGAPRRRPLRRRLRGGDGGAAAAVRARGAAPGLLRPDECARVLAIARRQLSFNTTPDSVDGRPTFEAPVFDRQSGPLNLPLCRALEAALETRAAPFLRRPARRRFGHRRLALCYALVRRYLPGERRVHPAHFDAHAAVTLVVALNGRGDYDGGYYVQPTSSAKSRCRPARRGGDAVCHTYKLRHGVAVRGGARYSLGDADACCNVAAHKMRLAGRYALHERQLVDAARDWYERAAMLGSCDAMALRRRGERRRPRRRLPLVQARREARVGPGHAAPRGRVRLRPGRAATSPLAELLRRARDGDDAEAMADLARGGRLAVPRAASCGSREAEAFLARFLVGDGPRRDRDRALFLGALRKRQSDDARRRRARAAPRALLLAAA